MNEQSISQRMAAKQAEAMQSITALLWSDGDGDEIAKVAIGAGLDPTKVDALAGQIEKAKVALQAAAEAHDRLPALTKALETATAKAATAARALAAADAADDAARLALGDASEALRLSRDVREAAARLLADGFIPSDMAPPFLAQIVAGWKSEQEATARAERTAVLKRQIPHLESRVEGLEKELAKQKATDHKRENQTIGAGGFVDVQTAIEGRLKTERENMKSAKAELRQLEKQTAA